MRYVWFFFWIMGSPVLWADLVCQDTTGKVLEYQSDGTSGTCLKNWVTDNPQLGYTANQIVERHLTKQEWQVLREAQIDQPAREAAKVREQARKQKEQAIKQKLNLSDKEFQDLKESLGL